jgi:transcriptional regulator with XRE-family HTH domain
MRTFFRPYDLAYDTIREYEQWELSSTVLPAATRLYNLPPIGLGTPMGESLTGYIARLAEAHCVSAGLLYWKEIKALAGKGNIFSFRVAGDGGYSTHTINGPGSPAADFVRVLEELTSRQDLPYLTMRTWAQVLPGHSLLRRWRAWCERCFQAWLQAKQPVYEPLLWTMQAVSICPYHRRKLRDVCPHCSRRIGPLDWRSRPGYCSRCERSLVGADQASSAQEVTGDQLMWATWVATALGELISAAPQIASPPTKGRLAQTIGTCIERTSSGNASAFARLLHVGRGDVSRWQRGKALPRLALLLEMAFRLGAPLLDFLLGSPACVSSRGFLRSAPAEPNRSPRRTTTQYGRRMNDPEVFRTLQSALDETPPPSVTQVMKRISHSEVTVRRHFPEPCREIAQHYAGYRVKRAGERKAQAAEEVKRLAYALHSDGIRLTRRQMRPLLTNSDYLNLEEGRAALREVRQELGL